MDLEKYVVQEFKEVKDELTLLNGKVDSLMLFMAVKKAEDKKDNIRNSAITAGVISLAIILAEKFLG